MTNWILFILIAAAFFGINDALRRYLAPQLNPILITSMISVFVAVLSFAWLLAVGKSHEYLNGWHRLWPVFLITGLVLVVGTVSQLKAFSLHPPLHVAMPILVVGLAVTTSLIGFFLFREAFHIRWLLGFTLALTGVVIMISR